MFRRLAMTSAAMLACTTPLSAQTAAVILSCTITSGSTVHFKAGQTTLFRIIGDERWKTWSYDQKAWVGNFCHKFTFHDAVCDSSDQLFMVSATGQNYLAGLMIDRIRGELDASTYFSKTRTSPASKENARGRCVPASAP